MKEIKDYFENLESLELKPFHSYIDELADTITTKEQQVWRNLLKAWLIATVKNLYSEYRTNNIALILGNNRKAHTWIQKLLPKEKLGIMYSCGIYGEQSILTNKLIIEIDEDARSMLMSHTKTEYLKHCMTLNTVFCRQQYEREKRDNPVIASFIGTITDTLLVPQDSRRFIPVTCIDIDLKEVDKIDINKVWAEAYMLYKSGYKFHYLLEVSKLR